MGDAGPSDAGPLASRLGSVEDAPEVDWLVRTGLRARVLRRNRGKLVAVAAFDALRVGEEFDRVLDQH